jgi:hypothetical protein
MAAHGVPVPRNGRRPVSAPLIGPAVAAPTRASAAGVVRRLVVYSILFLLVVLTATGLSSLLDRLFDAFAGDLLAGEATAGLAGSLTFTLVGGPLTALLGWFAWRRLADPAERRSLAWALYLVGMTTVALIVAGSALLAAIAGAVTGDVLPNEVATGLVWTGVWAGHRFVLRRSVRQPTRLPGTAAVLGGTFGLILAAGGSVNALSHLFGAAILGPPDAGAPWWPPAVASLVWSAGGFGICWWHWRHEGGRNARTALAAVSLVGVGVLGGALLAVVGTGVVVFVLLRTAFDRTDPWETLLEPLGPTIAAALVGSVVWVIHRALVSVRSNAVREAGTLVTSGVALVAAATGVGVVVNALLAAVATPLAGSDARGLLLAGISSVLVGGPLWWATWRPAGTAPSARRPSAGRGVYLVAVFGISTVVALITLLVIGFSLFDTLLAGSTGLIEGIRAPLGLLTATGLVSGYHFSVWRGDRAVSASSIGAAPAPAAVRAIGEVVLIMAAGAEPVATHLGQLTGAPVTLWHRAGTATAMPDPAALVRLLDGVHAERVVVIVAVDGALTVIPVFDPAGPDAR